MTSRDLIVAPNESSIQGSTALGQSGIDRPTMVTNGQVVFARFIARLAALPNSAIDALRCGNLEAHLERYLSTEDKIRSTRAIVSDALHAAIATCDAPERRELIELRRDLFNGRRPSPFRLSNCCRLLGPQNVAMVLKTVDILRDRDECRNTFYASYSRAVDETRSRFRRLLGDQRFQNGLVLSSEALFDAVRRDASREKRRSQSKLEQEERGLLRYFTRSTTKATPFGTFCTVLGGSIKESRVTTLWNVAGDTVQRTAVLLNKRLFDVLWSHLKSRDGVRRHLHVVLNPSLQADERTWRFLTVKDGREVVQTLTRNAPLNDVVDVIQRIGSETMLRLCDRVVSDDRVDAVTEEAWSFLNQLVDIGFLRLQCPVPEQDMNWDLSLSEALRRVDDAHAAATVDLLGKLRTCLNAFTESTPDERAVLLRQMRGSITATCTSLGLDADSLRGLPLYEDAGIAASMTLQVDERLREVFSDLAELSYAMLPMAHPSPLRATMRAFFDNRFPHHSAVSLLDFFQSFYAEHYKAHLEKEKVWRQGVADPALKDYDIHNPLQLPHVKNLRETQYRIAELFRQAWTKNPMAEEIVIDRCEFVACCGDRIRSYDETSISQFWHGITRVGGELRAVVPNGQHAAGFGKYFSRFLRILPADMLADIQSDNRQYGPAILAEIGADSGFNGNLHPPLLDKEILYPTSDGGGTAAPAIRCNDIEVCRDERNPERLVLRVATTQQRVIPVDLGFQNPRQRPPFFQLLSAFGVTGTFALLLPDGASNAAPDSTMSDGGTHSAVGVTYRPRFVYNNRVVLARKRWSIHHTQFPVQREGESSAEYFLRVNKWRIDHGIPAEVYATVGIVKQSRRASSDDDGYEVEDAEDPAHSQAEEVVAVPDAVPSLGPLLDKTSPQARAAARKRGSKDWRKPQYICFLSPLLLSLFSRLPGALQTYIVHLEECLPTRADLPLVNGEPHAAEFVFQLRLRASDPGTATQAVPTGMRLDR